VKKLGLSAPRVIKIDEKHGLLLNGFPADFEFPSSVPSKIARMKQLGNSVAVTAVQAWGEAVIDALDQ
jgi:DNA (cytosine-5)-methyltransferase 1